MSLEILGVNFDIKVHISLRVGVNSNKKALNPGKSESVEGVET